MKFSTGVSTYTFIFLLIIHFVSTHIVWTDRWAYGCDFDTNHLTNVQIRGEYCGTACARTRGCTHFTWTTWNSGTCWLKQGPISKSDAIYTGDSSMVCGVLNDSPPTSPPTSPSPTPTPSSPSSPAPDPDPTTTDNAISTKDNSIVCETMDGPSPPPDLGPTLYYIQATHRDSNETNVCALPASDYAVLNPVALGDIKTLKHLKFRSELCGQILEVNCGNGPLNVIITSSNYGGGLGLYTSTWNKLTNNKPPGRTSCTIKLTSLKAFNFNRPRCFYMPGNNDHYLPCYMIGLLNTNGRMVINTTIANQPGGHVIDTPYFMFCFGSTDENKKPIFTFNDHSTHSVSRGDCIKETNTQYWN